MKNTVIIFCLVLFFGDLYGQTNYRQKYNETLLNSKVDGNIGSIKMLSLNKNVLAFMEIGYFINGHNISANYAHIDGVINNVISVGKEKRGTNYKWIVTKVAPSNGNYSMKGKEFILFEGYLFRYIAQYQYLNPTNKISDPDFVKNIFLKWYNRSMEQNGDASTLYGIRLHMGSHWATVAAYLTKLDPKNQALYKSFVSIYDEQLKKSLKVVIHEGKECYVWNSTYKDGFTNVLKKRKKEVAIQDVSHGNHIVQYVVDAYNLGFDSWTKKDLERFANTLKYLIWNNKSKPSDYVDGTYSNTSGIKGMGWKQSDGWMKLMVVLKDRELFTIYDNFYKKNSSKINKFYPNLQYFANMALYQKQNK